MHARFCIFIIASFPPVYFFFMITEWFAFKHVDVCTNESIESWKSLHDKNDARYLLFQFAFYCQLFGFVSLGRVFITSVWNLKYSYSGTKFYFKTSSHCFYSLFACICLAKSANDVDTSIEDRILCYKKGQAPLPPLGYTVQPKVLYTSSAMKPSGSVSKGLRYIPNSPERILDAPNFMDDYCTSKRLVDLITFFSFKPIVLRLFI